MSYTVDQYGIIRSSGGNIIPQIESDLNYQLYYTWLMSGGKLDNIFAEPPKASLVDYKLSAKQMLANKADIFVERLTTTAGIPKSELANFESKAQEALEYVYQGKAIPTYSAINQEALVTGETIDVLCAKIIERVQQREYLNGLISGMRRTAGWNIDTAKDHAEVDAAVAACLAQAKATLGGFLI